jgi:hypothetical protein
MPGPETVSGTQVPGAISVASGNEHINGVVATLADDVASINTAQQDANTLPRVGKGNREGQWGRIYGGKTTDGGY